MFTVQPSMMGNRSRCTPWREMSGPWLCDGAASLSSSSKKTMPAFSVRRRAISVTLSRSIRRSHCSSNMSLRASEMGCDVLLKGTKVDGVYDADPVKNPDAKRYDCLSYMDVLTKDLGVMDHAAISLARENHIPVLVFSIYRSGAFAEVLCGEGRHTIIRDNCSEGG